MVSCDSPQGLYRGVSSADDYSGLQAKGEKPVIPFEYLEGIRLQNCEVLRSSNLIGNRLDIGHFPISNYYNLRFSSVNESFLSISTHPILCI